MNTTNTTETLRANLLELADYANRNRGDDRARRQVSRAMSALVFHGADVNEYRGVGDAGLSADQLNNVFAALPVTCSWRYAIADVLEAA